MAHEGHVALLLAGEAIANNPKAPHQDNRISQLDAARKCLLELPINAQRKAATPYSRKQRQRNRTCCKSHGVAVSDADVTEEDEDDEAWDEDMILNSVIRDNMVNFLAPVEITAQYF